MVGNIILQPIPCKAFSSKRLLFLNVALAIRGSVRDTGCGVGGPGGLIVGTGWPPDPLIRFMFSCFELRTLARLLLVLLARLTESAEGAVDVGRAGWPAGLLPVELEVEKIGATPSLAPGFGRAAEKKKEESSG
uniref:Uncharacterized protein n=1 Tax=Anopheles farauti TaxID=69004 RepID=A0A182QFN9_9DIPT